MNINKKGQTVITVVFWVVIFGICWALFLGSFLTQAIASAISTNGLTGFEAFLLSYLNLIVYAVMIIFIMGAVMITR